MRLATGLETHPATAAALADARVNAEQALAIIGGVDALPDDLDPHLAVRAEEHLIELAGEYDAKSLKGFARTILEVVAPDIADAHLAKQLERLERGAEEANLFRVWDTPDGRVRGDFDLDGFTGACLKKALFALSAPSTAPRRGLWVIASRPLSGWVRRSPSTCAATPSTSFPTPAASTPPSWS